MDTERLQKTWNEVTTHGDDVAGYFYAHLFVANPDLRDLFPLRMDGQRDRLVSALGRIVSSVDDLGSVVPYVQQLGRDHRRFSVVAEHYDAVGNSLLWTLGRFLGPSWTDEVAADWAEAYEIVASTMIQAAKESELTSPPWWDAVVKDVQHVSRDTAVIQVQPRRVLGYQSGQSMAVCTEAKPRSWRFYTPANPPRRDGALEFHVATVVGGEVSPIMTRRLKVGDALRLGNPVGTDLVIDPADDTDLMLVAGNTGVTPFLALLQDIERAHDEGRTTRRVHLVHGVRFEWNLYTGHWLRHLSANDWFDYTPVVSDDPDYSGVTGLVGDVAASTAMPGPYDALVCGSPQMVAHTRRALTLAKEPPAQVKWEEFADLPMTQTEPQPGSYPAASTATEGELS